MSAREAAFTMTSGRGRERDHLRRLREGGRGRLDDSVDRPRSGDHHHRRRRESHDDDPRVSGRGRDRSIDDRRRHRDRHESLSSRSRSRDRSLHRRGRSRSRSVSRGGRSRSRSQSVSSRGGGGRGGSRRGGSPIMVDDRDPNAEGEQQEELDEEEQMKRLMGFAGFDSTQGKKVVGSDASGVAINKQRTYRQYMNRRRGFNRNLSPTK
ncbi:hypothetical protein BDZ88DRAFT_225194 [Geranomyces variabilis]|nr:hypothetical protein BDZ88DRAFT_225194 [Geranomyces variabilis]